MLNTTVSLVRSFPCGLHYRDLRTTRVSLVAITKTRWLRRNQDSLAYDKTYTARVVYFTAIKPLELEV